MVFPIDHFFLSSRAHENRNNYDVGSTPGKYKATITYYFEKTEITGFQMNPDPGKQEKAFMEVWGSLVTKAFFGNLCLQNP